MGPPHGRPLANGGGAATEHSVLPLEYGDIHLCQDGPRHAPALLLIHGSAATTRSWDPLVPLLTGSHRVVRIDLLGHGRSAQPVGPGYEVPDQGRTVGAALDRLGIEQAVVVGHSSGGYTATALAEQRPDLVTALVLINTGPALEAFTGPETTSIGPEQWPPTDAQIRHFASTGFREGYRIPQELVDDMRGMSFHSFAATMRASTAYLAQRTLPDRLKPLGKPLQVVFGDQDRRWRPSSAADYRAVPDAKVTYLPGAGHSPILEDPPRTAELLLAFARAFPATHTTRTHQAAQTDQGD
ncbi:alpha/beta fold hydrolase [Streptomyces sp. NPDC021093]|uniref:alpha/beta fold hydrolase n=1 Tax=Streptomyces sp. NPDC021093 TaxID=3365112 RepID=UPI003789DC1A